MEQGSRSFKIYFSKEIRRFRLPVQSNYEDFIQTMCKYFPENFHPELKLKYIDSENEKILVSSEIEWKEMLEELSGKSPIHIYVEEGSGKYFKDGPLPEVKFVYLEKEGLQQNSNIPADDLNNRVTQCLQSFFPGGKILPHHIPEWLEEAIKIKNCPNAVVDVDIDVYKLMNTIEKKALEMLQEKDYQKALDLYNKLLILIPNDATALYNLSCTQSLLGNVEESLNALEKAIANGWNKVEHILNDEDLINIKGNERFEKLIQLMKAKNGVKVEKEPLVEKVQLEEKKPLEQCVQPNELETKWAKEIATLAGMGLHNTQELAILLEETNGNVQMVISLLM